jgi:tRNA(Ile)-lysidine synthase TilS/MesJ
MRTRATRQGRVVALCDCCSNTIEFIGLNQIVNQIEEKVSVKGWTVRHGKARCATCSELERRVLARALARLGADLSLRILLAERRTEWS